MQSANPPDTPAAEWSQSTLAALRTATAAEDDLRNLSGREQAAAQLAARLAAAGQPALTVDQQLASEAAAHASPARPPPAPAHIDVLPAAATENLTTLVPGSEQKTVPDLSQRVAAPTSLPSHNPFNPEHTPGYVERTTASTGGATPGGTTPGMELPGGWGAVLKTQGASALPHTDSTISQDVTTALHEVGRTAFGLLPESIVDKISYHHAPPPSATSPVTGEQVRETAANVGHTVVGGTINAGAAVGQTAANVGSQVVGGTINAGAAVGQTAANAGTVVRDTTAATAGAVVGGAASLVEQAREALGNLHLPHLPALGGSATQGHPESEVRTTTVAGHQDSAIDQAKNMAAELLGASQSKAEEAYNAVRQSVAPASASTNAGTQPAGWRGTLEGLGERAVTQVAEFGGHSVNPSTHATRDVSLPSEETTGAHPGEHSAGVGALPGSKFATGVAVLPLEHDQGQQQGAAPTGLASRAEETYSAHGQGYAPSGPAIALGGTSADAHPPHRSVTEIIKSGAANANKHSPTSDSSSHVPAAAAAAAGITSPSSEQQQQRHQGYAPSGPAPDLGLHAGTTDTSSSSSYLDDAAHPAQAKQAALSGGGSGGEQYELGALTGAPAAVAARGVDKDVAPAGGLGSSRGEVAEHRATESSRQQQQEEESVSSRGITGLEEGSSSVNASKPITGSSATASSTTIHAAPTHGSGPSSYDLAPPLGAIVGSTPLVSSHTQTDQSKHPLLPGNIPAALSKEPIAAAAAPTSSSTIGSSTNSGINTPGSTLESEPTTTTNLTNATTTGSTSVSAASPFDAARFQAPRPDRVDSHASTTAIMHGKLGNTHHEQETSERSSLKAVAEKELPKTSGPAGTSAPTTHSTSSNTATRAPGSEAGAVGAATSAAVAHTTSTPSATAATQAGNKDLTTANSEPHHTVKEEFASVGHGTLDKPASSVPARQAPKTESSAATPAQGRHVAGAAAAAASSPAPAAGSDHTATQHQRTASGESSGSKRSFFDKSVCIDCFLSLGIAQVQDPSQQALEWINVGVCAVDVKADML
ncbi:hypothetical protein QFC19_002892 [Naganishia cerealis]|uniref:Uncharacterized protein n=1 Tax=Naganishia cerealis TaxID=610337 RepID=A0ACC2W6C2_9TREE|nr:hypothetical protein QFC19_002892 [Naganishia cerealis]